MTDTVPSPDPERTELMPFAELNPPYSTIVADPPWPYKEKFAQMHSRAGRVEKALPYSDLSVDEIAALPVSLLAAANCRLFLWTTNKFLRESFVVMDRWGFQYKQIVVWHKDGNPSPWGGSVAPNHAEFLMVGVCGKPERREMWKGNVVSVNIGVHSVKPPVFMDLIEQVSPGPYVELFCREPRFGWDAWGKGYELATRKDRTDGAGTVVDLDFAESDQSRQLASHPPARLRSAP